MNELHHRIGKLNQHDQSVIGKSQTSPNQYLIRSMMTTQDFSPLF